MPLKFYHIYLIRDWRKLMNTFFNANTICTIITVIGSVITVSITYYRTRRIKLFDAYFSNKTRTYENFWNAASMYNSFPSKENKVLLRTSVYCLGLYSSPEVFDSIITLTDKLFDSNVDPESYVMKVVNLMRFDLDNCKKNKFF